MKQLLFVATLSLVFALAACSSGDDDAPANEPMSEATQQVQVEPTGTAEPVVMPGWKRYMSGAVEISLPERYTGGDADNDATFTAIRNLGTGCVAVADLIEQTRQAFVFVAVDGDTCATASIRSVQILEAGPGEDSPAEFIDGFLPGLPSNAELLEQREGILGGSPAAILRLRRTYDTQTTIQALYALRGEDGWYILAAAASDTDFDAAAPGYDEIAATFLVN